MKRFLAQNIIFLLITLYNFNIRAVIAGSYESVSVQSHTLFPAADADNEMRGFGWFRNGFTLENSATSCVLDTVYPIESRIRMNGGTLTLNQDLVFKDTIEVDSMGTFIGNGRNIDWTRSSLVGSIPPTATFQDLTMFSAGNFFVVNNFKFKGDVVVDAGGADVTFLGPLAQVSVQSNSTLTLRNMTMKGISGNKINCVDDTGKIIFNNVKIELSGDYSFSQGSFSIVNGVDFSGTHTFMYDSSQTSTVSSNSMFRMRSGAVFSIDKKSTTSVEPLYFVDKQSTLHIIDSTLQIRDHGAQFTKGTLRFTGAASVDSLATSTATAFVLGNGNASEDQNLIFDPSSVLSITGGYLVVDLAHKDILLSTVGGARINQYASNILYFHQDQVLTNLIIGGDLHAVTQVVSGKTLLNNNVSLLTPYGSLITNAYFVNNTTQLLNGNQNLILNGSLPLITLVSGQNNALRGGGDILAPIVLQNSNAHLNWNVVGSLNTTLYLNGGALDLLSNLTLGNDARISGSGIVHLHQNSLNLAPGGHQSDLWDNPLYFDVDNVGQLNMNSDIALNSQWTFSGRAELNGNGFTLDLTNGEIVVEEGSRLDIQNMTIKGVSGNKIRCADSAGLIELDRILWLQDGDFTFTQGSLAFRNFGTFRGEHNFAYQSTNTSIIYSNTTITLDSEFTFSYDPGTYPDLIVFTDKSSQLVLNRATMHATVQGMWLTKGIISVIALGTLSSEIVDEVDNGITLGDCLNPANDFAVNLASCVNFIIASGSLNYKNVNSRSWLIVNNLLFGDNTSLNVYKTLTNGTALTVFGTGCFLKTAPEATFNGSISGSPTVEMNVLSC